MSAHYAPVLEHIDEFQSFGFIEVGEPPLEGGSYPLNRTPSRADMHQLPTEILLAQMQQRQRSLEERLEDMHAEMQRLKQKVALSESENSQWSIRYSGRMVIITNLSLGMWYILSNILQNLQRAAFIMM